MGNYNPHAPEILGQEWVPIREEDFTLSPSVNAVEMGHGFTLATSRTLQSLRYYENTAAPTAYSPGQVFLASIYARGTEHLSGPIRSVLIPVNNGGATGSGISVSTGAQVANALLAPDDGNSIGFSDVGQLTQEVAMFFATNTYNQALNGKRILGVNFKYAFIIDPRAIADQSNLNSALFIGTDTNKLAINLGNLSDEMGTYDPSSGNINFIIGTKRLGEINQMWDTTSLNVPNTSGERLPWNYTALQRFEASASQRLHMRLVVQLNNPEAVPDPAPFATLTYAALEVFFCEEQRLVIGAFQRYNATGLNLVSPGVFPMTARQNNGTYTVNPSLSAGSYTVTLSSPDTGSLYTPIQSFPKLNALREYYAIPPHPGVQVNIPAPMDATKLGDTFTAEETHILPQITIHTSGGPLTEVHVYGRQAVAQVYGSRRPEQHINDDIVGSARQYDQVRFYARRFGDTSDDLDVFGIAGTSGFASISPSDFDALPEIIDGWKEVTLRLNPVTTMGALVFPAPQFRFSAAAETNAGNRWEVLGACAPALSGIPGNLFNLAPSPHQLGTATYEPPTGSTVLLSWVPQGVGSPPVTAESADSTSDLVLIFSQDPPAVSGFSVETLTQPVTGIGLDCGLDPCCIPTSIDYNQISWTALTSLPASGFGFYELQRMDDITDWQTIMQASAITGSSFNDYEARVGITSTYRIRAVNVYNFAGPWSSEVSITITEPGIEIGCEGGHLLIFTSNSEQSGNSNLAYSTVWEGSGAVNEDFDFPEAGDVVLQKMYNKDFVTAFRPLERGGERFTRTVLVQAAAISAPTLGNFTALRDMAWAQLPYVCVRDEDGNRWFATVLVPSGRVQLNRTIYMAPVTVMEVTDTAYPVDP